MIDQNKKQAAERYIRRIRNVRKQKYAKSYLAWIEGNFSGPAPLAAFDLGIMAERTVRRRLTDLLI